MANRDGALGNPDLWSNTTVQGCRHQILSQFRQPKITTNSSAKGAVAMQELPLTNE